MITAEAARAIADSKIANEKDSLDFKYAIELIERYVKDAASCGNRYFSLNVDTLAPGYGHPTPCLRKALAEELKKNGFSYHEIQRSLNCVWFEVSW